MGCISCSQEVLYIITVALFFKKQISYFILRLSLNFKKQRNKKQIKAIGGNLMNGFFQKTDLEVSQIFKKKQLSTTKDSWYIYIVNNFWNFKISYPCKKLHFILLLFLLEV